MRKFNRSKNDVITKEFLQNAYHLENKSLLQIANELGINEKTVHRLCLKYEIKTKTRIKNILNHKYNKLMVTKYLGYKKERGKHYWQCICDCGKECRPLMTSEIVNGGIKSCGCSKDKGYGDMCGEHYGQIVTRAKYNKIEMTVSRKYLWELFLEQNRKCYFTGIELTFCKSKEKTKNGVGPPQTASLDRLDSSKGYIEGNVVWVHKNINCMKGVMSKNEFISFCHMVANTHKEYEHCAIPDNYLPHTHMKNIG